MTGNRAVMVVVAVALALAWGGSAFAANGMVEADGKLYVVSGTSLVRIDLKTLKVEEKKDLTKLGADADADEQEKKRKEEWLGRYDENKDGEVAGDELEKSRWLRRLDANQDGKVTLEEVPTMTRPAPGATGEAELLVEKDLLIMLRGGMVFVFDLKSLEIKGTVKVSEPQQGPRNPMGGFNPRAGGAGGRGNRGGGPGGRPAQGGQPQQAPAGGANDANEGAF